MCSLPFVLCKDDDRESARAQRKSARASESAKAKAAVKLTSDDLPVHGFTALVADQDTLTLNELTILARRACRFHQISEPTPLQDRAFELMGIDPTKLVDSISPAGHQCGKEAIREIKKETHDSCRRGCTRDCTSGLARSRRNKWQLYHDGHQAKWPRLFWVCENDSGFQKQVSAPSECTLSDL